MKDHEIPSEINDKPDAALFNGDRRVRKTRQRRGEGEEPMLSITSLMDALTIILVFLLKNFSTSPVQLKESKELKATRFELGHHALDSTAITVTLRAIMVDDQPVVALDEGKVPDSAVSQAGLLIDPLLERLREAVSHQKRVATYNKKAEFKGICTIVADRHIPFPLIRQVLYAAGLAEFSQFKFAVIKFKE